MEQLGPFHFFFTLSCAERKWPEMIAAILQNKGHTVIFKSDEWDGKGESIFVDDIPLPEFVEKNLNPKWKIMEKTISGICNGDYEKELKIEIYDHDSRGKDDLIGEVVTNLRSLAGGASNGVEYDVINHKMRKQKKNYQRSGTISVAQLNFH